MASQTYAVCHATPGPPEEHSLPPTLCPKAACALGAHLLVVPRVRPASQEGRQQHQQLPPHCPIPAHSVLNLQLWAVFLTIVVPVYNE